MRELNLRNILLLILLATIWPAGRQLWAQVAVNPASLINMCPGGSPVTLSDILITETDSSDFEGGSTGSGFTYVIRPASPNFRFVPGQGLADGGATNLSVDSVWIRADSVKIWYTMAANSPTPDTCRISGLQMIALAPDSSQLLRSGGNSLQPGNGPGDSVNHGILIALTNPVVNLPQDSLLFCPGSSDSIGSGLVVSGGNPPYSYNWSPATFLNNPNIPNPVATPAANQVYVLTVTDDSSCTGTDTLTLYQDNIRPTAICKPDTAFLSAAGSVTITPAQVNNGSADNCSISSLTLSKTTFVCTNKGNNPVSLFVQDNTGLRDTCTAIVTVLDTLPPTAICKDVTTYLNASGTTFITAGMANNNSSDVCGISSLSLKKSNFNCTNVGISSDTLTLGDPSGNTGKCGFFVTVIDTFPPAFTFCPADTFLLTDSAHPQIPVSWATPTASDACGIDSLKSNFQPGDTFAIGTTPVVYVALDPSGNSDTCSFTVTVASTALAITLHKITDVCGYEVSCNGDSSGIAWVKVTGGVIPYQYLWSDPVAQTTDTAVGLAAGNYAVQVTDANGDFLIGFVTLGQPAALSAGGIGPDQTICPGKLPSNLVNVVSPSGGPCIRFRQWQVSTDTLSWTDIPGATGLTYTPVDTPLVTTWYRRAVWAGTCDTVYSNFVQISLYPEVNPTISGLDGVYCESSPRDTLTGSPAGGTLSGPGISGIYLYPNLAGVGNHSVTYTYTAPGGCIFDTLMPFVVHALPTVTLSGLQTDYCVNSPDTVLTGLPAGGTFFGTGMTDSLFQPGVGPTGSRTIKYIVTNSNGCTDSASAITQVHALPVVNFFNLQNRYCQFETGDTLAGYPTGGTFAGTGISGNYFSPDSVGTHAILYTYTDGNFCSNSKSRNVIVDTLPDVSFVGLGTFYTPQDPPVQLQGNHPGGSFSGPGVATGTFYPSIVPLGANSLVYSFSDSHGCSGTDTAIVVVDTTLISGLADEYCENSDSSILVGSPYDPQGFFSGPGIVGDTFFPAIATPGTYTIYYHFRDSSLGWDSISQQVVVNDTTPVSIQGLNSSYCQNSPPDSLSSNQSGGFFSGPGMNQNVFYPAVAGPGQTSILYTFTNGDGCTSQALAQVTVYSPTKDTLSGLDSAYCTNSGPVTMIGSPPGGIFSGNGVSGNTFSPANQGGQNNLPLIYHFIDSNSCHSYDTVRVTVHNIPTVVFSPISSQYCHFSTPVNLSVSPMGGNFTRDTVPIGSVFYPSQVPGPLPKNVILTYTYQDTTTQCVNSASIQTQVVANPQASFSGLAGNYCINASQVSLSGAPAGGSFSGNGVSGSNFLPSLAQPGFHDISYFYTDVNGCRDTATQIVRIDTLPTVSFSVIDTCENKPTLFTDLSTVPPTDTISSWNWFMDNLVVSLASTAYHSFQTPGDFNVSLTVTTNYGCSNQYSRFVHIGAEPQVAFHWTNICQDDNTVFHDDSQVALDNPVAWNWEYGDSSTGTGQTSTHAYQTSGNFPVLLQVTTDKGCIGGFTDTISILPTLSDNVFPYFRDFENGKSGWEAGGEANSSWQFGQPSGDISGAFSGVNAWVTNLNGDYNDNEQSTVLSPCFNFSKLDRPMVSFQYIDLTQETGDGVVLQASVDGGLTWEVVGDLDEGVNWYNKDGIQGDPGGQGFNPVGWSNSSGSWIPARHKLDAYKGQLGVRFRFALGSNASSTTAGFAFDDFQIRERNKTLLFEEFTNNSDPTCFQSNPGIYNLINANQFDVKGIFYHTISKAGTPADPMNLQNPADVSGREIFYGFNTPPWAALDGNYHQGPITDFNQDLIDLRTLDDAIFLIDTLDLVQNGNLLTAMTQFRYVADTNSTADVQLQMAVIERKVGGFTAANGETNFEWVMKKMLPDAGGTLYTATWQPGTTKSATYTWDVTGHTIYDPSQLELVVFLQNKNTREVYQTAYSGPQLITASEPGPAPAEPQLLIWPNPARDLVRVEISEGILSHATLINLTGQVLRNWELHQNSAELSLEGLSAGVYLLNLQTMDGQNLTRKIVVE
ncbi:MAG: HYR domain-containing protein [Bacteroidia bacterium]|nr:HYR domain-containing protein [Bacteroidia bacterium]